MSDSNPFLDLTVLGTDATVLRLADIHDRRPLMIVFLRHFG